MGLKKLNKQRIVLGISGGVDSAVSAYLLKEKGYDVIGLFMQNWDTYLNHDFHGQIANNKSCNVNRDYRDAQKVAKLIGIKIYRTQFIDAYWKNVFQYVIDEYQKGNTPNPDILCNKYIKFGEFIKYSQKHFKTKNIAMGHYASTKIITGKKYLIMAKDQNKDQTYFLCWLKQNQLDACQFPIGNLTKDEVRKLAKKIHLPNWNKKDSTGICFIGERKFAKFLTNYIKPKPGKIIDIVTNHVLGQHNGYMFYTIGQNKNLGLGGQKSKYYVCKKDVKQNIIYVVDQKHHDQFLKSNQCRLIQFNWINGKAPRQHNVFIRFRHRGELVKGSFVKKGNEMIIKYAPTTGVADGQFAVIYQKNVCLGGGIIRSIKQ